MRLTLSDFAAIAVIVGGCVSFAWFTLDSRIASMEQRVSTNSESLARIERGLSAPKH